MSIDEAVAHAREVAEGCPAEDRQCAYQHDKLADWLEELKAYRETGLKPEEITALIPPPNGSLTQRVLDMVRGERERQDTLWGDQSGNSLFEWVSILGEEYGEFCEAVNETCFKNPVHPERGGFKNIVKEAVEIAAVAVAVIETAYRRKPEEG